MNVYCPIGNHSDRDMTEEVEARSISCGRTTTRPDRKCGDAMASAQQAVRVRHNEQNTGKSVPVLDLERYVEVVKRVKGSERTRLVQQV